MQVGRIMQDNRTMISIDEVLAQIACGRHDWEYMLRVGCIQGDFNMINMAITNGARSYSYCIWCACEYNRLDVVKAIINKTRNIQMLNMSLASAYRYCNYEMIDLLDKHMLSNKTPVDYKSVISNFAYGGHLTSIDDNKILLLKKIIEHYNNSFPMTYLEWPRDSKIINKLIYNGLDKKHLQYIKDYDKLYVKIKRKNKLVRKALIKVIPKVLVNIVAEYCLL